MARKRRLGIVVGAVLGLVPAWSGAADSLPSPAVLRISSAYVAKQLCSCLFVTGRPETACRLEFKPQIDMAKVVVDRAALPERARVSVALLATVAEASYSRRYGCVLAK